MLDDVVIVETRVFTSRVLALLSDEDYRSLQLELVRRPGVGAVISGSGGLRKLRWAMAGGGKRGGARIIYYWHPPSSRLLMLFAYPKNERADLSAPQREALRKIVELEYP
jgi:hypothetical protein